MSPSLQTRLKALANRYTPDGWYAAYELDTEEHVGTIENVVAHATQRLRSVGYGSLPTVLGIRLSAAKRHPETGALHDATVRKVPTTVVECGAVDDVAKGTELADYEYERLQYHVHAFGRKDGTTDVFCHLELRSDLHPVGSEDWSEAIGRLMIHYSPKHSSEYLEGATEPKLEQLL